VPQRAPNFLTLSLLVAAALAAALIGVFRNDVRGRRRHRSHRGADERDSGEFRAAVPFAVILAVLLWLQRGARWDEAR